MQIGLNELLIILIVIIAAYGLYRGRPASGTRSTSDRADQQAAKGQAGDANAPRGNAWSEDPGKQAGSRSTSSAKDPYVVLNVPRNATQDEITASYKKLAQMYHPDKVAGLAPEYYEIAETKMKDINAAYAQIGLKSGANQ
jgi:DnaJ-domain-containing protein 1